MMVEHTTICNGVCPKDTRFVELPSGVWVNPDHVTVIGLEMWSMGGDTHEMITVVWSVNGAAPMTDDDGSRIDVTPAEIVALLTGEATA